MELSCFLDPADVGNLISGFSAFSKSSLNIWTFTVYVLLKPGLKNFEHYFASVCDKCSCAVVWAFSKEYNQMVISTWRDVPHRQVISRMQFSLLFGCHVFSHVQLFVTPWTVAYQAPPSMEFSRQEYWSGVPLPSPTSEHKNYTKKIFMTQITTIVWSLT